MVDETGLSDIQRNYGCGYVTASVIKTLAAQLAYMQNATSDPDFARAATRANARLEKELANEIGSHEMTKQCFEGFVEMTGIDEAKATERCEKESLLRAKGEAVLRCIIPDGTLGAELRCDGHGLDEDWMFEHPELSAIYDDWQVSAKPETDGTLRHELDRRNAAEETCKAFNECVSLSKDEWSDVGPYWDKWATLVPAAEREDKT